jgi:hypothetical protein
MTVIRPQSDQGSALDRPVTERSATMPEIFRHRFTIPAAAVDANGHLNNVVYVPAEEEP